jgi:pimeloyl-ACP methyl ester carboxylesterase
VTITVNRWPIATLAAMLLLGAIQSPALAAKIDEEGINRSAFVPIGGIDQWLSIEGDDRNNPVLLVVHGGPGEAQWPQASRYKAWERTFVVVQWDQRGAGHTYGRYGAKTPDMTLSRITKDGIEVAEYLCRTLGKKKIVLLGHSWGSIVAVGMVKLRPELFAAYVGTAQVASWKASVNIQFDLLLAKARRDSDNATIRQLEKIGRPDPGDASQYFAFSRDLQGVMASPDREWIKSLRAELPALLTAGHKNFQDFVDGFQFSAEHLLADQMSTDLPKTANRLNTAFFIIQGRDDVITPTQAAVDYFDQVRASRKELIIISDAGHFAYLTAPDAFLAALIGKVRPAAIERGA